MRSEVAGYLAGIVDGEGNIGLLRRNPKPQCGEINPTFLDYVKVTNTDYRLLSWIKEHVGAGSIYAESRNKERSRKVYTWHISSKPCLIFLRQIYPFLVVKKEQADVIFQFRMTIDQARPCKYGMPEDTIKERERLCSEMVRLHNHVVHGKPIHAGPQTTERRRASQLAKI